MTKSSDGAKGEDAVSARTLNGKQASPQKHSVASTPASSRQSSAVAGRRPGSGAVAFQQASEVYNEAILEKRLELVQKMQDALANTGTVAYQTIATYSHLLDGAPAHKCT